MDSTPPSSPPPAPPAPPKRAPKNTARTPAAARPSRALKRGGTTGRSRVQLDRTEWVSLGLEVLAEEGVGGVRVEVLAKRFGVTKGSFYWHFKDRQDLLSAILEEWKRGRIADIIKQTRAEPGQVHARIYHVIDVYSAARNRRGIGIELAVRDWARRDPEAAATVEEVERWRLECACKLFLALGLPEAEAKSRSLLLYAYVFGQSLMSYASFDPQVGALRAWIADLIAGPSPAPLNA